MTRPVTRQAFVVQRWASLAAFWLLVAGCGEVVPLRVPTGGTVLDPYDRVGEWYKGNFHMHTSHSDGRLSGGDVVELYGHEGYAVLCVSDHNMYGDQDGGIQRRYQTEPLLRDWNGDNAVHPESLYASGLEAYVRDWTSPRPEWMQDQWFRPAHATLSEAPIVLSGVEVSHSYWGTHFVLVGVAPGPYLVPSTGFSFLEGVGQSGAFAFLAHPAGANAFPQEFASVVPVREFHGIEILNGLRLTRGLEANATPLWDALLTSGYRLWGLANDDSHTDPGATEAYPFTAFNMLLADSPTPEAFLEALHSGAFYASAGLLFDDLGLRDGVLVATAPGARLIRFIGPGGILLQERVGARATYEIGVTEGYVRIEAIGDLVDHGAQWEVAAWSQPFFIVP